MRSRVLGTGAFILAFTLAAAPATIAQKSQKSTKRPCEDPTACDDERENFETHFFVGSAIDNFAAGDVNRYLNPDASGDVQTFERLVAGIDFSYRLFGGQEDDRQLWLYGGTIHGVRSTEVNCEEDSTLAVCQDFIDAGAASSERFLFIARNASSLEALFGLRAELLRLHPGRDHSASFFLSAQYGFVTVSGAGDDVQDVYHYGLGVIATKGQYRGSYFEVGHGGSDLFVENPDDRWKIIGQVNWWPEGLKDKASAFARIIVDADFSDGPDSVQSYFGMRLGLSKLFSGVSKSSKSNDKDGAADASETAR